MTKCTLKGVTLIWYFNSSVVTKSFSNSSNFRMWRHLWTHFFCFSLVIIVLSLDTIFLLIIFALKLILDFFFKRDTKNAIRLKTYRKVINIKAFGFSHFWQIEQIFQKRLDFILFFCEIYFYWAGWGKVVWHFAIKLYIWYRNFY